MKNLTPEMIEKAKAAKSAEELLALAKENNVEMTADEAKTYFAQLNPKSGELNDDELDAVAGGGCNDIMGKGNYPDVQITGSHSCPKCGSKIGYIATKRWEGAYFIFCKSCDTEIGLCLDIDYVEI